jgi:hypothetical protein
MFGAKLKEIEITKERKEVNINVSKFQPGVYLAVIVSRNERTFRRRFVKL